MNPANRTRTLPATPASPAAPNPRYTSPKHTTPTTPKTRTRTNLYNGRPTWLTYARAALDRAVWSAYAWPADEDPATVPDETILQRLLALNTERSQPT